MRKGFTLVELAIVLVIIGIIMGMAIKGKSLIDSAKIRADLAKFNKLQTAWAIYTTKRDGKRPPLSANSAATNWRCYDMQVLISDGSITQRDIYTSYGGEVNLGMCGAKLAVSKNTLALHNDENDEQFIMIANGVDTGVLVPRKAYCNYELIVDDKSAFSGDFRANYGDYAPFVELPQYDDCDKITGTMKWGLITAL